MCQTLLPTGNSELNKTKSRRGRGKRMRDPAAVSAATLVGTKYRVWNDGQKGVEVRRTLCEAAST